jgi:hypothetical protein
MQSQELMTLIASLSPEEQTAVQEFIRYLKDNSQPTVTFRAALDSFVRQHPELLRRLVQ